MDKVESMDLNMGSTDSQNVKVTTYPCLECRYVGITEGRLQTHQKANHPKDSPKCNYCKAEFTTIGRKYWHQNKICPKNPKFGSVESMDLNMGSTDSQNVKVTTYPCLECNYKGKSKPTLRNHIQRLHPKEGIKVYPCEVCNYKGKSKDRLRSHKLDFHPKDVSSLCCLFCKKRFAAVSARRRHQNKICLKNLKFGSVESMDLNMGSTDSQNVKVTTYPCLECYYVGITEGRLEYHRKIYHPKNSSKLECEYCKAMFLTKSGRNLHQRQSCPKKPESVPTDVSNQNLVTPLMEENQDVGHLRNHQQNQHPTDIVTHVAEGIYTMECATTQVACEICGVVVHTSNDLRWHRKVVHLMIDNEKLSVSCNECGYIAKKWNYLVRHIKNLHRKFRKMISGAWDCTKCLQSFNTQQSLEAHADRGYCSKTPVVCHFCNARFLSYKNARYHIISCHRKQSLFPELCCKKCTYVAVTQKQRIYHEKIIHNIFETSERYQCKRKDCGRVCGSKQAFDAHMNVHKIVDNTVYTGGDLLPYLNRNKDQYCGTRKCGKCSTCNYIITRPVCEMAGQRFVIKEFFDCNTKGVIYAITCSYPNCNCYYVGLTKNSLKIRLAQHLHALNGEKLVKLYEHFQKVHGEEGYAFLNVEIISRIQDTTQVNWVSKLKAVEAQFIEATKGKNSLNSVSGCHLYDDILYNDDGTDTELDEDSEESEEDESDED